MHVFSVSGCCVVCVWHSALVWPSLQGRNRMQGWLCLSVVLVSVHCVVRDTTLTWPSLQGRNRVTGVRVLRCSCACTKLIWCFSSRHGFGDGRPALCADLSDTCFTAVLLLPFVRQLGYAGTTPIAGWDLCFLEIGHAMRVPSHAGYHMNLVVSTWTGGPKYCSAV